MSPFFTKMPKKIATSPYLLKSMLWTQNGLNWSTSFFSASNMLYFNRKTHKMEILIFQRTYFLSHAMEGRKNCHLKYDVFSNFFVKISKKIQVHIIYTKKTNIFQLEKLIRHTFIAILTTDYVQFGQNIFWLQLERRYMETWILSSPLSPVISCDFPIISHNFLWFSHYLS